MISFCIQKTINYGEAIFVSGNIEEVGFWDPNLSVRLNWNEGHKWTGKVKLKISLLRQFKFKFFIADWYFPLRKNIYWENHINNRSIIINPKYSEIKCTCLWDLKNTQKQEIIETEQVFREQKSIKPTIVFQQSMVLSLQKIESFIKAKPTQLLLIKSLDLSSHAISDKLTPKSIEQLIKVQLPNITSINLQNNRIADQGIAVLCKGSFKELKSIQLNNNGISVSGVSHLLNNKWSDAVTYKLDTVKTKDQGFAFNIGSSMPTMKRLIKQTAETISNVIDELTQVNKSSLYQVVDLMMQIPLQGDPQKIIQQSKSMEYKLQSQSVQNPNSLSKAILEMKNVLEGAQVTFSQKTNIKSQLSCKILFGGMQEQRVKLQHRIVRDEWKFVDFKNDNDKLLAYQLWEKEYLAKEYGARKEDIVIHKVTQGSTVAWISVSHDNYLLSNSNFTTKEKVNVIPFFQAFNLTPDDFDSRGNFQFPHTNISSLQFRAGIPYFQPIYGMRFGVNVSKKYDGGNDDWLMMDGNPSQWAVAFHGINYPGNVVPGGQKTVLQAIMSGRERGQMLIAGAAQACSGHVAANKPGQHVGIGIYCSPLFTTCLDGYTQSVTKGNQTYKVMLQCRIKPEALKCTAVTDYWVINEPKNIRPYGIVLFSSEHVATIKAHGNSIYQNPWNWNSWKDGYQKHRTSNNLPFP